MRHRKVEAEGGAAALTSFNHVLGLVVPVNVGNVPVHANKEPAKQHRGMGQCGSLLGLALSFTYCTCGMAVDDSTVLSLACNTSTCARKAAVFSSV